MDGQSTDVVGVSFEARDLLGRVVVVDTHLEVIAAADNPVLSRAAWRLLSAHVYRR